MTWFDRYQNGEYLEKTKTWHAEDSAWKSAQIEKIVQENKLRPATIAEIGCGAGGIIEALSGLDRFRETSFEGYDISPQALELASHIRKDNVQFFLEDFLAQNHTKHYDLLLVIDVFEHVPDYLGFVEGCKGKAEHKIYHIPLDIHVSSVLRNSFLKGRRSMGHLHYFTAESAIATLEDTGHEIIDVLFTDGSFGLFRQHPSIKKVIANIPRWVVSRFSTRLAARLFGGYSLLVLAR